MHVRVKVKGSGEARNVAWMGGEESVHAVVARAFNLEADTFKILHKGKFLDPSNPHARGSIKDNATLLILPNVETPSCGTASRPYPPAPLTDTGDAVVTQAEGLARLQELGYPASLCLVAYKQAQGDINLAGAWLGEKGEQYIQDHPQYFHDISSGNGSDRGSGSSHTGKGVTVDESNVMAVDTTTSTTPTTTTTTTTTTTATTTATATTTPTTTPTTTGTETPRAAETQEPVPHELAMVLQAGLAPRTLVWGLIPAYLLPQYTTTTMTYTHLPPAVAKYSQVRSTIPVPSLLLSRVSWSQVWSAGDVGVGVAEETGATRPWHWDRAGLGCLMQALPSPVVQVAVADSRCTLVCGNGSVYDWVALVDGKVGYPVKIQALEQFHVIQAAAGARHTVYLSIDGLVFAAGRNNLCQLGFAPESYTSTQEEGPYLVYQLPRIQQVAASSSFTLALAFNGDVYLWGAIQPGVEGSDLMYIPEPRLVWSLGSGLVQGIHPSRSCIYIQYHTGQVQVARFDQEMIDAAVQGDLVLPLQDVAGLQNIHVRQLTVSSTRACALTVDGHVMECVDGIFHSTPLTRTATAVHAYRHYLQVRVQVPTRHTHLQNIWNQAHCAGDDNSNDKDNGDIVFPFDVYLQCPGANERVGCHRVILAAACPLLVPLLQGKGDSLGHIINSVATQDGVIVLHLHPTVDWQHLSLLISWLYADHDVDIDQHIVTQGLRMFGVEMDSGAWQRVQDLATRLYHNTAFVTAALQTLRRCWAHIEYTRTPQGRECTLPTRQHRLQRWPDAAAAVILDDDVTLPVETRLQLAAPLAPGTNTRVPATVVHAANIWAGPAEDDDEEDDDEGWDDDDLGSDEEDNAGRYHQPPRAARIGRGGPQGFGFGEPSAAWQRARDARDGRRARPPVQAIHQRLGNGGDDDDSGDDGGSGDVSNGTGDATTRQRSLQAALKRLEGASSDPDPGRPQVPGPTAGSSADPTSAAPDDPPAPSSSLPRDKGKDRATVVSDTRRVVDPHRQARLDAMVKRQQDHMDLVRAREDGGTTTTGGGGGVVPVCDLHLSPTVPWTDVLLCCESGEELACHALIVTACPYIRMAIQHHRHHSSSNDCDRGMIRIALPSVVGAEEADTLLSFLYTGQLEVGFPHLMTYIACADVLQLSEAKALLGDIILQDIDKIETSVLLSIVPGVLRFNMKMVAHHMYLQLQLAHRPGGRASSLELTELSRYVSSQ